VALTGPDGLLKQLTKTVLETALNQEMTEHLGHDKHGLAGNETGNVRNGTRGKTVLTEASGQVPIDVPRDRAGTFEPQIVRKRQRRLSGVDEIVLSLYAKGLTTGEISAHFADIYGASVSKETISRITDKVLEEMTDWCSLMSMRAAALRMLSATAVTMISFRVRPLRPLHLRSGIQALPSPACPSRGRLASAAFATFPRCRPLVADLAAHRIGDILVPGGYHDHRGDDFGQLDVGGPDRGCVAGNPKIQG